MTISLRLSKPEDWVPAILRDAPAYLTLQGASVLEARARSWAELQLDRISSSKFAETFEGHCPIAGCEPGDYNQRILQLASGDHLLLGIRFKGEDLGFPFVDLVASTAPFVSHRAEILDIARQAFRAFAPRALRVVGPETRGLGPDECIDQSFHAADLAVVADSGEAELKGGLTLEFVDRNGVGPCLALVEEAYEQFRSADPALAAQVPPADREQLEDCATRGFLTLIKLQDRSVGVLAVLPEGDWLFDGLCMVEEVLLRECTGQGLAARAQRLLARELHGRGRKDVLWGTITEDNVASRKTAERTGRKARAAWRFIDL